MRRAEPRYAVSNRMAFWIDMALKTTSGTHEGTFLSICLAKTENRDDTYEKHHKNNMLPSFSAKQNIKKGRGLYAVSSGTAKNSCVASDQLLPSGHVENQQFSIHVQAGMYRNCHFLCTSKSIGVAECRVHRSVHRKVRRSVHQLAGKPRKPGRFHFRRGFKSPALLKTALLRQGAIKDWFNVLQRTARRKALK